MSTYARTLDLVFWGLLLGSGLCAAAIAFAGCTNWQAVVDAANAPTPTGTVLTDGLASIPAVVSEPWNFYAWGKLSALVLATVGAGFGVKKIIKVRNA